MGFFSGKNQIKLNGHKELTNLKPTFKYLEPKIVAIALKNMGCELFDIHVNVDDTVKIGTKLATRNDHFNLPIFSSVSGKVIAIEKRDHVTLKKTTHIIIESDFKEEKQNLFEPVTNLVNLTKEEIVNYIKEYGVLGLGGAGFPTYVKYSNPKNISTVLINGVECEPYITADEISMKKYPELLFEGTSLFIKAASAKNGIIAIKEGKKELYEILLKESNNYENIEVRQVPDVYPMGWERTLVREVFKKDYDKLPSEVGVVVDNSETATEFARSVKTGLPMYERIVTLSGKGLKDPQNVQVKVGTLLSEVINAIGGYAPEVPKNYLLVAGGPFMGKAIITDNVAINSANNAFIVVANDDKKAVGCLRCGACINYCPAGLQPVQIALAGKAKNKELLNKLKAEKCIECGTCTYVCPSYIPVSESTRQAKTFYLSQK